MLNEMDAGQALLTNVERTFAENELIVSKTDTRGLITYANDVFQRLAGYHESELLGMPHSIVRHPHMPRCVFRLLWETVSSGEEIFAYVINRSKNGDHYWVFAHVTPTFGHDGKIIGYHSNRRRPEPGPIGKVKPLYQELLSIEQRHSDRKEGLGASYEHLIGLLSKQGIGYDEFIFGL